MPELLSVLYVAGIAALGLLGLGLAFAMWGQGR